jgi:hypothetical protein
LLVLASVERFQTEAINLLSSCLIKLWQASSRSEKDGWLKDAFNDWQLDTVKEKIDVVLQC